MRIRTSIHTHQSTLTYIHTHKLAHIHIDTLSLMRVHVYNTCTEYVSRILRASIKVRGASSTPWIKLLLGGYGLVLTYHDDEDISYHPKDEDDEVECAEDRAEPNVVDENLIGTRGGGRVIRWGVGAFVAHLHSYKNKHAIDERAFKQRRHMLSWARRLCLILPTFFVFCLGVPGYSCLHAMFKYWQYCLTLCHCRSGCCGSGRNALLRLVFIKLYCGRVHAPGTVASRYSHHLDTPGFDDCNQSILTTDMSRSTLLWLQWNFFHIPRIFCLQFSGVKTLEWEQSDIFVPRVPNQALF